MSDPIDVLGVHPAGAHPHRPDTRDYPFTPLEIAEATAPFDWNTGYDVERDINFTLPTKDQGQSFSCGGQAFSMYEQVLAIAHLGDNEERSAKYPYSQVYVPGGGSSDSELAKIIKRQGFGLESLTPSYQGGATPTEAFMERSQDITASARLAAAKSQIMLAYAFPTIDIDAVAQALSACKGVVLGLGGSNNGTWLSTNPKSPLYKPAGLSNTGWNHYMYGGKAKIENGKRGIWAKQSWGAKVGDNGWQFIDEDYFASGFIWGSIVLIFNPAPVAPPQHTFNTDLKLGMSGLEVTALQQFLAYDGEFNLQPTGYYGQITANAVLNFQLKYGVASLATLEQLGGDVVGPATRAKLNSLTK